MTDKNHDLALMELFSIEALEGKELRWARKHLKANPHVSKRIKETQEISALLSRLLVNKKTPSSMRESLLDSIGESIKPQALTRKSEEPILEEETEEEDTPWRWEFIIGGLALIVIIFLVYDLTSRYFVPENITKYFSSRPKKIPKVQQNYKDVLLTMLYEPETRFASFKGLDPSPEARGLLVWNLEKRVGYLHTSNLPDLDPSASYKLWAFNEEGPHFVDFIKLDKKGNSFTKIDSLPKGFMFKKFGISMEYFRDGNEKPSGKIYLMGDVNR